MKNQAFLAILAAVALAGGAAAQTVDSVVTSGLREPHSVAVDANNVFYISDSANNRIVKYAPDTGLLTELAGVSGPEGSQDGIGVLARFFDPKGIIVARGGLVVADYGNHRIRFVSFRGVVSPLAGVGEPGKDDGAGPAAKFNYPIGLAADGAGNIFVADSKNNAIRKIDANNDVTTVAISGLYEPAAVAIGDSGDLWVADTRNHTVKCFHSDGTPYLDRIIGSNYRYASGSSDALFATNALFNHPRGLLWMGGNAGMLVSDSGNHALRQIYFNSVIGGYSVSTFAGTPGEAGFVNGPLSSAKLNSPIGLARDVAVGGFIIVDSANNALRRIQTAPPLPPVSNPSIGWVDVVVDRFSGSLVTVLVPVTQSVFNNEVKIAILAEAGTETFYTFGPSPASVAEDNIPSPDKGNGKNPLPYRNGLSPSSYPRSMLDPQPDLTIKAIGTQDGRRPSSVVQARFQFKTGNPIVMGDNAAAFVLTNVTEDAQMYYTVDGSDPTNNTAANPAVVGPVNSGRQISLNLGESNLVFKARAFKANFLTSAIITNIFSPTNFVANTISFGFTPGDGPFGSEDEASSGFVTCPGQRFFAPVVLSLLAKQRVYSLQFDLSATNVVGTGAAPLGLAPGNSVIGFSSMLVKPAVVAGVNVYLTIHPEMFIFTKETYVTNTFKTTNDQGAAITTELIVTNKEPVFQDLLFTNYTQNMMGVGWLERLNKTNLYDTTSQDLVTFSLPHDTLFESKNGKVVLGAFEIQIPKATPLKSAYQIAIGRPSATSDGIGRPGSDVFILAPTNGSLAVGKMNAVKYLTVGSQGYVVGDAAPFRWFNAGDFGNSNLLSDDVMQVFQSAIYRYNTPPYGSDMYDALDASNGQTNGLYSGSNLSINGITTGDGRLEVDDVFVTFRRSLDPTLKWYARVWSGGNRVPVEVPNVFRGKQGNSQAARSITLQSVSSVKQAAAAGTSAPAVSFSAGDVVGQSGESVAVPIQVQVTGDYPLRVLMLNLNVRPLEDAPPVTVPVKFLPSAGLGEPTLTLSRSDNNYAAAWLNENVQGISGNSLVGTLVVAIPARAGADAAYRVEFEHISASPNGLALFPKQVLDGILTMRNRPQSDWADGIPDSWRLKYFGTLNNLLSHALADADGDGVPNWAEFMAGTNPTDVRSRLELLLGNLKEHIADGKPLGLTLRWPSVANKRYVVESSPLLTGSSWTVVASDLNGTGQEMEFVAPAWEGQARFFRVRIQE